MPYVIREHFFQDNKTHINTFDIVPSIEYFWVFLFAYAKRLEPLSLLSNFVTTTPFSLYKCKSHLPHDRPAAAPAAGDRMLPCCTVMYGWLGRRRLSGTRQSTAARADALKRGRRTERLLLIICLRARHACIANLTRKHNHNWKGNRYYKNLGNLQMAEPILMTTKLNELPYTKLLDGFLMHLLKRKKENEECFRAHVRLLISREHFPNQTKKTRYSDCLLRERRVAAASSNRVNGRVFVFIAPSGGLDRCE